MAKKRIGLDLDSDGTMLPQSIWVVADKYCFKAKPDLLAENYHLRRINEDLYKAGRLSRSNQIAWAKASADLYRRGNVTMTQVRDALQSVSYRPGLREHLEFLRGIGVPVAINSWGVKDFIDILLENHQMSHLIDRVSAGSLIVHDDRIMGIDEKTLVHPSNKGEKSREFARDNGIPLKNLLAITDSPRDHWIGHYAKNRLGVTDKRSELEKFRAHPKFATAVYLPDGRFDPAAKWILDRLTQFL